jgi:large subunit ribosomal protein L18
MNATKNLNRRKAQRIRRVRALISGTAERPRLVVNRTNKSFSAQLIDDVRQHTILSISNLSAKKAGDLKNTPNTKTEKTAKSGVAFAMGESLGKKAVEKGIVKVVFDRRSYQFHGRVKNFADGAKKGGLSF